MRAMKKEEGDTDGKHEQSEPLHEGTVRERNRVPILLAREAISVEWYDEKSMQLVPYRATKCLHEWSDRS